jgi:hypothetical protein
MFYRSTVRPKRMDTPTENWSTKMTEKWSTQMAETLATETETSPNDRKPSSLK